jgi:hypothetical protein
MLIIKSNIKKKIVKIRRRDNAALSHGAGSIDSGHAAAYIGSEIGFVWVCIGFVFPN